MTEFADFELQLKEAISHFNSVLESKSVTTLSEVYLHIEPKYESDTYRTFSQRLEKVNWKNWFHFLEKTVLKLWRSHESSTARILRNYWKTFHVSDSIFNFVFQFINPPKKVDPFSDASNRTGAEDIDFSKTDAFKSGEPLNIHRYYLYILSWSWQMSGIIPFICPRTYIWFYIMLFPRLQKW